jgi:carboxymethylenebutenolidase
MSTQYIELQATDGSGSFRGYLAMPKSGRGPGLVIAQEIFGINHTMRAVADYYAGEGYAVLVPDLFWRQQPNVELGYTPADWQRAFEFYKGFDEGKGVEDLQSAISALRSRPEVADRKVGVLGFCLGGKLAYLAACRTDADVSVSYYGVGIDASLGEAENITRPLLLHVAELDKFSTPAARDRIEKSLRGRPNVVLHVYPGTDHAFAREGGEHYDESAAELANRRSIDTLRNAIGPQ